MILKIVYEEGKSTLIDNIHNIKFERFLRDDYPELPSSNNTSKYIYEVTMYMKDGEVIKEYISTKFYIMNDDGRTIEIIKA